MKKKTVLTIALSFCGLLVICVGGFFAYQGFKSKTNGHITINVFELNNLLVKEKNVEYKQGDTLVFLVKNNFDNVVIDDGMIMSIESITTPKDWSTFIAIYVDNKMSNYGINDIKFGDGDCISFVNTVFVWDV